MRVVVVSGPPCAGKTTHIAAHRGELDVVIDFDALAHTLGYPTPHVVWPRDGHPARTVALRARATAIRTIRDMLTGYDGTAWVVVARQIETVPHDELVLLDPGEDVCLERAAARGGDVESTCREIGEWYAWAAANDPTPSRTW